MSDEVRAVELLILRNQRAIMKHLIMVARDPASELIDQAQETFDMLKRLGSLKPPQQEKINGQ